MIDLDEFKRILKQQSEGPSIPASAAPTPATPPEPEAAVTADEAPKLPSLTTMLDQQVTLEGVARDAFLGAVLLRDNGTPVYLDGLDEWDDATSHQRIQATGVLRKRKLAPDPVVDSEGGVSHGAHGTDYVLEDPTWSVL